MTDINAMLPEDNRRPGKRVRIAFVGLGRRGLATLGRYMLLRPYAEAAALVDVDPERVARGAGIVAQAGEKSPRCFSGPDAFEDFLRDPDVDITFISTQWTAHASMAVRAMEMGCDVAVEVPLATTEADCRAVVSTARRTGRFCFMLENCCFDPFHLATLRAVGEGLLGAPVHLEGAYIHDLRSLFASDGGWLSAESLSHPGNPYPTHGLGPMVQLLRAADPADALQTVVAVSGHAAGGDACSGVHVSSALLRTRSGASMLLQYDVTTPRPYSRLQSVCGTQGYMSKYPLPMVCLDGQPALQGPEALAWTEARPHPWAAEYAPEAQRLGHPNLMNYIMDRRLLHCVACGLPPDIAPEDAAQWSAVAELTARSSLAGGIPLDIPTF